MFTSLKLFVRQKADIDDIASTLIAFGYRHDKNVYNEGDFSRRGGVVDIFPTNFDTPVRLDFDDDIIRSIVSINPVNGKILWQHKIIIILPQKTKTAETFSADTPLNNFIDIQEGDYVVHNHHGIGRFLGITDIERPQEKKAHLVIEYEGGDKLFVPKNDMHLVQKYVGFTKNPPRL